MTNPYVGPKPLSGDQPIYGREREIADVYNLLIAERIVLLCSPSGAGKSSLISAKNGLLDRMKKHFDVWPVARVHERPPAEAGGVNRYCWSAAKQLSPATALGAGTLVEALRPPAGRTVFLVFDQFEEVLTTGDADIDAKREFFRQLGDFLMLPNVWALFSMREDYLAPLDPYRRLLPTHLRNRYRLNLLDKASAELAIRCPAKEAKREFTDSAVAKLTSDLAQINVENEDGSSTPQEGPYVEPLHLQLTCELIWEKTAGEKTIGAAAVSGQKDVDAALRAFYEKKVSDAALHKPGSGERDIREWFERSLINSAGIRRQVMLAEGSSEGLPNDRIWELAKGHLVRKEKRGEKTFFELAHDRLIRPVQSSNKDWFESKLNGLEKRADAWNLRSRPPALLARRKELKQWEREGWKPNRRYEEEYIEASRAAVRAGLLQAAAPWAAGVLLALLSLAAYYFKTAEREKILAESGRLAVSALHFSRKDSAKGLEVAIAAFDKAETLQTIETLHETVQAVAQDNSRFASHTKLVRALLFLSEDELISGGNDGKLLLWNAGTGRLVKTLLEQDRPIEDVRLLPGAQRLLVTTAERVLTIGADGAGETEVPAACPGPVNAAVSRTAKWFAIACESSVVVLDGATMRLHKSIARAGVKSLAFGAEEDLLAVAGDNNMVELWDAANAAARIPALASLKAGAEGNQIRKVVFSPDGSMLAAGGNDGRVISWYVASGALKEERSADENGVHSVAFHPVAGTLATGGGSEGLVCHWPAAGAHTTYRAKEGMVESIAFSPSGARLATGADDWKVRVFETSPAKLRKVAEGLLSEKAAAK